MVTTGNVNDSIELFNKGTSAVDVSGWILKDGNNSSKFQIPAGTTLFAGGFRAFDVHSSFGLGSSDSARLYLPDGSTLVDSFSWSQHSNLSWSRGRRQRVRRRSQWPVSGGLRDVGRSEQRQADDGNHALRSGTVDC